MTAVTSAVRRFEKQFPDTLDGIKGMVRAISRFEKVNVPQHIVDVFGKITAHDVVSTRKIATRVMLPNSSQAHGLPYFGCNDCCHTLIAALRSKGLDARFVLATHGAMEGKSSLSPHSLVLISFEGKKYLADPFWEWGQGQEWRGFNEIKPGSNLEKAINEMKKNRLWLEMRALTDYIRTFRQQEFARQYLHDNGRLPERKEIPKE